MAGHSKWANIKHRKAAQDAKRGKIFTKLIREITVSAREGGADADSNPRLRAAIDKALSNNMKRDTVDTAIKRGAGELDGDNVEEITYEGYGPSGVAVMVECMSDNRNRTVAEVRFAFSKCNGNLGTDGSVAFMFNKRGVLSFAATEEEPAPEEDALMEAALEAGVEDVVANDDGSFDVYTTPADFGTVLDAMRAAGFSPVNAEVTQVPDNYSAVDEDTAKQVVKLIDMLEDSDDVQNVYHNAELPESAWD